MKKNSVYLVFIIFAIVVVAKSSNIERITPEYVLIFLAIVMVYLITTIFTIKSKKGYRKYYAILVLLISILYIICFVGYYMKVRNAQVFENLKPIFGLLTIIMFLIAAIYVWAMLIIITKKRH